MEETTTISYFKKESMIWQFVHSGIHPVRTFSNRSYLSWPMIFLLVLFLNGLSVIPVTLQLTKIEKFPIQILYPSASVLVEKMNTMEVPDFSIKDGRLQEAGPFKVTEREGEIFFVDLQQGQAGKAETSLVWKEDELVIEEKGLPSTSVPYLFDYGDADRKQKGEQELENWFSRTWTQTNLPFLVFFFSLFIGTLLFISLVFLMGMTSLILYLTNRKRNNSFKTIKEALHTILHALMIPTFAAFVISLFYYDPLLAMTVQAGGIGVILLGIFYRTAFQDDESFFGKPAEENEDTIIY